MARQIATAIGIAGVAPGTAAVVGRSASAAPRFVAAVAKDLLAHRGASLVIAGDDQPPAVHALAHAMNAALGSIGRTVTYIDPIEASPVDQLQSLRDLTAEMNAGQVDLLVVLGGNPVYTAPADFEFGAAMAKVPTRVHFGLHANETSEISHWQIPEAHFLETWSDGRGIDGTVSIVQPLILPIFGGRSAHEVLSVLNGEADRRPTTSCARTGSRSPSRRRRRRRLPMQRQTRPRAGVRSRVAALAPRRYRARHGLRAAEHDGPGHRSARATGRAARRHGDRLPKRPCSARRPLRQQRLAAGAARSPSPSSRGTTPSS